MRSFSISFTDEEFDESVEQELVAREFGMTHDWLRVSSSDVAEAFPAALWHAEIPQFRTALVPMFLLSRRIRDAGVKVVLSGEGADEVFFGYDVFKETRLRESWAQWTPEDRRERIRRLYPYLKFFSDANVRALETVFARSVEGERDLLFSHALRIDNGRFAARLLNVEATDGDELTTELAARFRGIDVPALRRAQWIEFHTLLQGYLLSSQGDRMAFAHGVEPRCPYLSPAVVHYAASLPVEHHLPHDDNEKAVLKRAFRDVLPPRIVTRPKQPYRAPGTAALFAGPGRFVPWVEERLAEPELRCVEPLNVDHALRLAQKVRGTPSERISPREDQAFLLLLSLLELDRLFVRREGLSRSRTLPPLTQSRECFAP
jgi:asparagine synthase (glutamine-hydrolysing)